MLAVCSYKVADGSGVAVVKHRSHSSIAKPTTHTEVVHTTANHPWLSADHGWLIASFLHVGEPVRQADGRTATVVAIRSVPGAADMWDLTVSQVHDFAVGNGAFVVHNCGNTRDPNGIGFTQDSISSRHGDGHMVGDNIQWLKDNPGKDLPPVEIFQKTPATDGVKNAGNLMNGEWYSLDNRRLYEYQQAGRTSIPVTEISDIDAAKSSWKWTTNTWGIDIRVR